MVCVWCGVVWCGESALSELVSWFVFDSWDDKDESTYNLLGATDVKWPDRGILVLCKVIES